MKAIRLCLVLLMITMVIGLANAAPLEISLDEKVNTTVNTTWQNGNYVQTYKTNVTGYINITNTGNDIISDIWIAVNLKNITGKPSLVYKSDSNINVTITPKDSFTPPPKLIDGFNFNYSNANWIIHITYLRPNDIVSIFYDVNDSKMGIENGSPFIVDETYNVSKISARMNAVWKVSLNVSINETWFNNTAITNKSIDLNITKYLSNNPNYFGSNNWKSLYLVGTPQTNKGSVQTFYSPYDGVNDGNKSAFNVTDIKLNTTLDANRYVNITFNVAGYCDVSSLASLEPFGFAVFEFNLPQGQNVSGSYVTDVFAVGNVTIVATKNGPEENSTGQFALWKGNATVNNTANGLAFVITNLTVWATKNDINKVGTPLKDENTNNDVINATNPWVTIFPWTSPLTPHKYTGANISFNYSQVPIVWANCTFKVIHNTTYGWWANSTTTNATNSTHGSDYIVIERIYVIGTYLVKVTKHVIPNATQKDVYDIYLVVENIGPMKSPEIYVYDLIPENFTPYNWNDTWTDPEKDGNWVNQSSMLIDNDSVDNPMSGYSKGLEWHLHGLNGSADGDGSYTDWDEIKDNRSVVIFYQVKGTGSYKLMDAFIVGIDPMFSMNSQTAHRITIVSGAKATSYESLMALMCGITFIGIVVITRRNGKKE